MTTNSTRRAEAGARGEKHFQAIKPCKNGHKPIRYVSNGDCVDCVLMHSAANYEKNRARRLSERKSWRDINRSRENEAKRDRAKRRRATDNLYRLQGSISALIRMSFKKAGKAKSAKTEEILGCSILEFMVHIERQFLPNMSWDNRDKWHIDHITPISQAKTVEDLYALNRCSNLRPLWSDENRKKSDRITHLI